MTASRRRIAKRRERPQVLFVVVPFSSLPYPALGVSLLKAALSEAGIPSTIRYFNLEFCKEIGVGAYDRVANSFDDASLLGDWVFSKSLFDDDEADDDWYELQFLADHPHRKEVLLQAKTARSRAEAHLDRWAGEILATQPRIVGFTTSFQQNGAALALAKRIKQAPNPPIVIFGGANCFGEMAVGLLRAFPWIDYVCNGEGDEVFPLFARRILAGADAEDIPGILKQSPNIVQTDAPMVRALDQLPMPDYSEFFDQLKCLQLKTLKPQLLIETSRGCWWGQKHHCTFCSIWTNAMAYRSKSPERTVEEYRALAHRYRINSFLCVDNILDVRHISTVLPKLAETKPKPQIFYEVKANLRYDQLKMLKSGGVRWIQPGIESFSDDILRIMKKGCSAIQNLQLLRWSREIGIYVLWNLLFGFPGEPPEHYDLAARLIPKLHHLHPPLCVVKIRMDRYSPNFNKPEMFGFHDVRVSKYYAHVFPASPEDLHLMAHFFDYEYADERDPFAYTESFRKACNEWQAAFRDQPVLDSWDDGEQIRIRDTRRCAIRRDYRLTGLCARIYRALDAGRDPQVLKQIVAPRDDEDFAAALQDLIKANLIIQWEGKYIALAIFRRRPVKLDRPPRESVETRSLQQSDAA